MSEKISLPKTLAEALAMRESSTIEMVSQKNPQWRPLKRFTDKPNVENSNNERNDENE